MDVEFNTDFFKKLERLNRKAFLRQMTQEAGVIAVNFSKDRFRFKNWLDKGRERWKPRKRPNGRGSLLVRTGRLKRSIRKILTGDYYVMVGTDVPYAPLHNEGGEINKTVQVKSHQRKINIRARKIDKRTGRIRTLKKAIGNKMVNVRAHNRKMNLTMPKRQFLGDSEFLGKLIGRHITREINKTLE